MFKISFDIPVSDKVAKTTLCLYDLIRHTLNDSLCNKIMLKNELNNIINESLPLGESYRNSFFLKNMIKKRIQATNNKLIMNV